MESQHIVIGGFLALLGLYAIAIVLLGILVIAEVATLINK
jgi:hypothetical protein